METEAILPVIVLTIIVAAVTCVALVRQVQIKTTTFLLMLSDDMYDLIKAPDEVTIDVEKVSKEVIDSLSKKQPMYITCKKQYISFYYTLDHFATALLYKQPDGYEELITAVKLQRNYIAKRYGINEDGGLY